MKKISKMADVHGEWDFNAPQFVDFTCPQPLDDGADEWFDAQSMEDKLENEHTESTPSDQEQSEPVEKNNKENENHTDEKGEPPAKRMRVQSAGAKPGAESKQQSNPTQGKTPNTNLKRKSNPVTRKEVKSQLTKNNKLTMPTTPNFMKETAATRSRARSTGAKPSPESKRQSNPTQGKTPNKNLKRKLSNPVTGKEDKSQTTKNNKLTLPTTPTFMKRKPRKVGDVKTTEQMELDKIADFRRLMAEKRKMAEKSRKKKEEGPVPHTGLPFQPKLTHKCTQPEPFQTLEEHTQAMLKKREMQVQQALEEEKRKEEPLSRQQTVSSTGLPVQPKPTLKCTQPEPFKSLEKHTQAMLKKREMLVQQALEEEKRKEELELLPRPRSVPHTGLPFQPKPTHKCTQPEPFKSIEEHTQAMLNKREMKVQQALEEEKRAREFRAQPLPDLDEPQGVPEKQPKPPTEPEPFSLEVEERGAKKAEQWSQQVKEELKQQRQQANFKAQPVTVVYDKPFVPSKSNKPLTDICDFELNTDRRAEKRSEFESYKKTKEMEIEALNKARQREIEEEEKEAIAKLRKEMVHKHNPIRHYKPVVVVPSDKPLTEATTPRFSARLRQKSRFHDRGSSEDQ